MKKWLKSSLISVLSLVMFSGCSLPIGGGQTSEGGSVDSIQKTDGYHTVKFELCTDLKTNAIDDQEVEEGDVVVKPSVGVIEDNPDRMEIDGWYTDAEYTNPWNFTMDVVEEDMTLYAKWVKKYAVTFYLGEETDVPMFTQYVKDGGLLKNYEKLADGYESDGFFTNARFTEKFDPTKPITCDQNVYIHRSEHFYFSGKMIAERFNMFAAPSGEGSKAGTIEYKEEEGTGEGYAEINFGYSTAADPYALLSGVTVDVSHSQKLEVTFRNLGKATSLKFYYLTWMADGSNVDGAFFNENNTYLYQYEDDEIEMKETDEWVTKTFDFDEKINNGVSNWAISSTMIQLRIQSSYVSENQEDLSNIVQIKSIKGIPDDTYTSTDDTERVASLRVDDDATAVQEAADAQADVCGWVFPKDYSCAEASSNAAIYEKTNGLLFYSKFREKDSKVTFNLSELIDENGEPVLDEYGKNKKEAISLDDKTTMRIRLTNYGYANSIKLTYENSYGFAMSKQISIMPCGDKPESREYILNMFGESDYESTLDSISFSYDSVGVDNAILFESVEFLDFKMIDIPGVNFNDKYAGNTEKEAFWTTTDAVAFEHNGGTLANGGTVFTTQAGAYVERATSITNVGYETMTLKYKEATGVRNVIVTFTIGGVASEYNYDLMSENVKENNGWNELTLPLTANGQIERVKVAFIGVGSITVQELRFNMGENVGLDFSTPTYVEYINAEHWSGEVFSYDNSSSAAVLSAKYNPANGDASTVRYYYDAMYKVRKVGDGNIDISEKSKIIVIYNNTGNVKALNVGLGLVNVTEDESWKIAHMEIGSPGSGGMVTDLNIKQNMAEGEWAVLEIDLSKFNTLSESTDGRAINEIGIQQTDKYSTESVLIRAIIIL